MTLHKAIVQVLKSANRAMTTQQLADEINKTKIYNKKDGSNVSAYQIHGRTRKYSGLFDREGDLVRLKGDKKIEKIIIENFKVFEGQHVFDLNNLNVFTGANNSGKSTLMKAISLFSKGLEGGVFPTINLFDVNAGEFENLINRNSNGNSFKIGFFIELGAKRVPFKVLYEFVGNEYADGSGEKDTGTAKFSNIEVLDIHDCLLFGAYSPNKFAITKDNIEYEFDGNLLEREYPFSTPSEGSDNSLLMMKFNIEVLEKYIKDFTNSNYSKLISQMKSISEKHNNWWCESFLEYENNWSLDGLTFANLLADIKSDYYCNIGELEIKCTSPLEEDIKEEKWNAYNNLKDKLKYNDFIKDVVFTLFDSIDTGLGFFRKNNFTHIVFQNFGDRLINKTSSNSYLFSLFPHQNDSFMGLQEFVRESLKLFGFDGYRYFELISHLNSAIEINLVFGLKETDIKLMEKQNQFRKENKPQRFNDGNFDFEYFKGEPTSHGFRDYNEIPRQNISDLGKGTANLFGLILKIYSVFHGASKERSNSNIDGNISDIEPLRIKQKFILIEEPEAFLHPDWQSKLADFFVFCTNYDKKNDVKFIIETHSEYLIRKLQYLTAKKKIKPEDSVIYYFHHPDKILKGEKQVKEIRIQEDGSLTDDFGPGFFDEADGIALELYRLQRNKAINN